MLAAAPSQGLPPARGQEDFNSVPAAASALGWSLARTARPLFNSPVEGSLVLTEMGSTSPQDRVMDVGSTGSDLPIRLGEVEGGLGQRLTHKSQRCLQVFPTVVHRPAFGYSIDFNLKLRVQ